MNQGLSSIEAKVTKAIRPLSFNDIPQSRYRRHWIFKERHPKPRGDKVEARFFELVGLGIRFHDSHIRDAGVFWPKSSDRDRELVNASDHRLVWIEVELPQ